MTYQLYKPVGSYGLSPIPVPDNAIDYAFYDATNKVGVQLVGRNSVDYGTAVAQNVVQMVSNFSGSILPNDTIALQGQLWFNSTSSSDGELYVRHTSSTSGSTLNWRKIVTTAYSETGTFPIVNPVSTPNDGDIRVTGSGATFKIEMYGDSAWNQIFPAVYS